MDSPPCLLAADQALTPRWGLGALFRLQEGGFGSALEQLDGPSAFKAMIEIFWASLPEDAWGALRNLYGSDTPAALARALERGALGKTQSLEDLREQLILLFNHSALTAEKKSESSTSLSQG